VILRIFGNGWARGVALAAVLLMAMLPVLNLSLPANHPLHISSYFVALFGKFMCYAIAAVALDLVWGYAGIL